MNKAVHHRYLLIFLLSFIVGLPFLSRGLFESSEGRYALIAKNMLQTHNFWVPQLDGAPHLTKPPLTYWLIALGEKALGMSTMGARFIHSLCWILLSLLMVRLGELFADKKTGLFAGLIFSTALFPVIGSWFLTTDPILVFFQGAALWSLLEFRKTELKRWSYLFWASLGFAFLTKGPVSLFPILFWIPFCKSVVKKMMGILPVVLFLLISCFWYIGLEINTPGVLKALFQSEIIKRSTTDYSGRNPFWWAPIVTYVLPIIVGWGLWPLFLKREKIKTLLREREGRFYLFWIVITLAVFSLIQSRLILYILPLTIPCTLLLARALDHSKVVKAFSINFLLLLLCKAALSFYPYDYDAREIAGFIRTHTPEKVYYLGKDLYGVQFYLGPQVSRFHPETGIGDKKWFFFPEKRRDFMNELVNGERKEVSKRIKVGQWHLLEVSERAHQILTKKK